MAYESDLETDFSTVPLVDAMGAYIIEFVLGFDLDEDKSVVMSVMLVPGGSYVEPVVDGLFDLRFGIREIDLSSAGGWRVTAPDYSREAVEKYIPKELRTLVLLYIGRCAKVLVETASAAGVTMETYYSNLEGRALEKYDHICSRVHDLGFETKESFRDGTNGKNYWFLIRTN
jgi:hypothetical protein